MLVRLAAVFSLLSRDNVLLTASGLESAGVFAANAKKNHFSDVAEIKTDAATIWPAVFPNLVPNQVALVDKTPVLINWQKAIDIYI